MKVKTIHINSNKDFHRITGESNATAGASFHRITIEPQTLGNFNESFKLSDEKETETNLPFSSNKYVAKIPSKLNVLIKANSIIEDIKNENVLNQVNSFNNIIRNFIITNINSLKELQFLPPLNYVLNEDGSVLVEWIFRNFRVGFSFELNEDESSWYFVSNFSNVEHNTTGYLKKDELENTIISIIDLIIQYV